MGRKFVLGVGRLGKDPVVEEISTNSGDIKTKTTLNMCFDNMATKKDEKGKGNWLVVEFWGDRNAELLKNLKSGQLLFVTGEEQIREYTDKEGSVREFRFLSGDKFDFVTKKES